MLKGFQPLDKGPCKSNRMQAVKESFTQLLRGHAVFRNMVRHDQDTVTDGHDGPLFPSPGGKTMILSLQIASLGPTGTPRGLCQVE